MIVYSDRKDRLDPRLEIRQAIAELNAGDLDSAFVRFARIAPAILDSAPGNAAREAILTGAGLSLAHGIDTRWRGESPVRANIDPALGLDLPSEATAGKLEGYAWYGLYPEMYGEAAREFLRRERPASCLVIGIRSIGDSLGWMVRAALERDGVVCKTASVRPHGHPWDRCVVAITEFNETIRAWRGHFCIVDEGPGISGSSFASVIKLLLGLGVDASRIALFPSWDADGSTFNNHGARELWSRCRRYPANFDCIAKRIIPTGAVDISAGEWRRLSPIPQECWPAVQAQHERRKYLAPDHRIWKFAGLGIYGTALESRARALGETAVFERGFLISDRLDGHPPSPSDEFAVHAGRYVARVRELFQTDQPARIEELQAMLAVNTREILGFEFDGGSLIDDAGDLPAVALDARMQPHEWLSNSLGFVKTDALEHHSDHFFPGPADPAWDIAGVALEFQIDQPRQRLLIDSYVDASGDRTIERRLGFYRAAYAAFRAAYAKMAAGSAPEEMDRKRYTLLAERYARALTIEVAAR